MILRIITYLEMHRSIILQFSVSFGMKTKTNGMKIRFEVEETGTAVFVTTQRWNMISNTSTAPPMITS